MFQESFLIRLHRGGWHAGGGGGGGSGGGSDGGLGRRWYMGGESGIRQPVVGRRTCTAAVAAAGTGVVRSGCSPTRRGHRLRETQ